MKLPTALGLLLLMMWPIAAHAETNPPIPPATTNLTLTGLRIIPADPPYIEADGAVALREGILEFISVEPRGREYESLLTLIAKPSALQFALLLIGCEPGHDPAAGMPTSFQPQFDKGSRLRLEVQWQAGEQTHRVPVEQWLRDRKTGKAPDRLEWVFNGSFFNRGLDGNTIFQADAEEAHIALWWNPAIPINVIGNFGIPYQGDDLGFEVFTDRVPPTGTPVTLILRKAP
ncbi:MAG: YdjY domain-containing protein [Verrucomicrobiae bacterium]|nr:YdjY domain-containing protein [Verrucomicrobiae bacterium]